MKKVILFEIISLLALLTIPRSVYAQANYPIINTATTVVGEGGVPDDGGGDENPSLPPIPTLDEFLKYFEIYSCTNSNLSITSDCQKAQRYSRETGFAYGKYSDPMRSLKYRQLLNIDRFGKIRILFKPADNPRDNFCDFSGGGDYGGKDIRLSGYMQDMCDQDDMKWSMIHESGHIIQDRLPVFFNTFRVEALARADGSDCYDDGVDGSYIQTYKYRGSRGIPDFRCLTFNGQLCDGGGPQAESFGEAVGMNVVCGPNKTCQKAVIPINNYPGKCKNTYDWVKQNVYGGIDFFNPGSGGNTEVVKWASTIASNLDKAGPSCLYNVQRNGNICSRGYCAEKLQGYCDGTQLPAYLCTQLIIDSYNLAGNKNTFSLNTYLMEKAWEEKSGYKVLYTNDQNTIKQLKAGDVVFMFNTYEVGGLKHVVVIRNVQVDGNGNGKLNILQSNSNSTANYYPIHRWKIIHYYRDNPNATLMFGLGPRK